MRITIAHRKTKQEAIDAVDRAIQDAFQGLPIAAIRFTDQKKAWNGSVMSFSMNARLGFLNNPISGTVEVTDRDITIDADLGLLNTLLPQEKIKTTVESRVKGLLT
jgi:hypothetical protein